jgi:hypothetical protein
MTTSPSLTGRDDEDRSLRELGVPTHTPGPWRAVKTHSGIIDILDPRSRDVVTVYGGGVESTSKEANARLIAAAPDLLEALKDILRMLRTAPPGTNLNDRRFIDYGIAANRAIAKAEGRS